MIQTVEHSFVEDTLTFQIEETAPLGHVVIVWHGYEQWNQNKKHHHRDLNVAGTHLQ